jgi:serine/threonine-protein kinase
VSSAQQGPLTVGRVVDERYEVTGVLSRGHSGTVYLAEAVDEGDEPRRVALKVLHEGLARDRQVFGRFKREARILKRLHGSHVACMLDFVAEEDLLILVLEYVDGPSLETYLASAGPLGVAEAVGIARQLCVALQAAHDADVIHRDLKPSNVLLEGASLPAYHSEPSGSDGAKSSSTPRVKVVDFGLAKILHGDGLGTALTEHDMIFGTPDYMSPEQVRGDELDGRCDLYALGALLFEMVVGHVPYRTEGALTTMTAHLEEPVPSACAAAPSRGIPRALDQVLARCLAKDRADRYRSAGDLAQALQASLEAEAAEPDEGEGDGDTLIDPQRLSNPIGTTLESHRITGLEAGAPRGAKVKVLVTEAEPDSAEATTRRPVRRPASKRRSSRAEPSELRIWTVAAVVAAAVAVAVGIWFGVR